jgi:RNA polymerase sigma-70 factor (ECF subfamily)
MPTDEQLIEKYLAGDDEALRSLIERYLKPIHNFIYRYVGSDGDAEDLTQETFVSAWKNLKKPVLSLSKGFDPQKGKFKTWIFAIAKNTSLNWIKKKKPDLFSAFSAKSGFASGEENENGENALIESIADPSPLPDELFHRADLALKLSAAIKKLNPNHQTVLLLRYNDHFTFREIAESLGEPLHTIKSRHRRALITLKRLLTD